MKSKSNGWYASEEQEGFYCENEVDRRLLRTTDEASRKLWFNVLKARKARKEAYRTLEGFHDERI